MDVTDKMMEKVRALIAKAESTDSPAESEALYERANQIMTKHMIDEAMLEATRPAADRMRPGSIKIDICTKSHLDDQFTDLAMFLSAHYGCRIIFFGLGVKWLKSITATVYGYESALRSFEMMYTALHLDLASQLTPKPVHNESFDENVYRLHEAGVNWSKIAQIMNRAYESSPVPEWRKAVRVGKAGPEILVPWPDGHRLINAYRRWCEKIGDTPRAIQSPVTYQRNFAVGYVNRVSYRLAEMRHREEEQAGAGSALVLRQDAVDSLFEESHPDRTTFNNRRAVKYNWEARQAGDVAGQRADLGQRRAGSSGRAELA